MLLTVHPHVELYDSIAGYPIDTSSCGLWTCGLSEGEKMLDLSQPLYGQVSSRQGKKPAVFLRYREQDANRGYIRVYPKGLR